MMEWWQILLIVLGSLLLLFVLSIVFYKQFFKRFWDIVLSGLALIVLSPILLILMIVGAIAMGGNPFFTQKRPGKKDRNGNERIFKLIKFRTMSNKKDDSGNLLPDEQRLNKYGKFLRSTSLDELPELLNIFVGDMSIIGPRPQLVRDMVFMTDEQRHRHDVKPGLSGLAQVNGRNNITWEQKFEYDLEYIKSISLFVDFGLIFKTIFKVFKRKDTVRDGTVSDIDFGDWLLQEGKVSQDEYDKKQNEARKLLGA
ncbi:MAG: Undecaprenyl phosphate N,N'-diacetylbacillosamine 1-phosphate transferase [Tenericutes bacterium ADurb.BinA124]|nr:MAG: Undecaprenyl phosphate N,N'-diacetylbacillosamine 1-phosphate transferase [Tenericutes bacterium ADurb.BinA124]